MKKFERINDAKFKAIDQNLAKKILGGVFSQTGCSITDASTCWDDTCDENPDCKDTDQ